MTLKDADLRCKCGCGLLRLHRGFRDEMDAVAAELGRPVYARSCCRCKAHNDRPSSEGGAGGHVRSLHVGDFPHHADKGQQGALAVDWGTPDGAYRGALFAILWKRGWSVGWGNGFLHGDRRDWIGMPQTTFDY